MQAGTWRRASASMMRCSVCSKLLDSSACTSSICTPTPSLCRRLRHIGGHWDSSARPVPGTAWCRNLARERLMKARKIKGAEHCLRDAQ